MNEQPEPIQMLERRFNLFPARFTWRGRVYHVDAVNECKTMSGRFDSHGMHHYWVRSDGQLLHLCEVFPRNDWLIYRDSQE
ncbi:MAG TPA: hypothetical protein P5526_31730 [Anaerolineae bacterium]|nr:hypothetical protein [Anaerolineae bacterium]MCB9105432.1 hypothetical protein [Anaerolineales bacterium]HRV96768.1 hypothetical protein [Anaerolineae bacterium]